MVVCTLIVPLVIVTLATVKLPRLVTVLPNATVVLPIVTELFANWLFAILPNVPPKVIFPEEVTFPVSVIPLTVLSIRLFPEIIH